MYILECFPVKVRFLSFLVTPSPGVQDIRGISISIYHNEMQLTTSSNASHI